jgi:hypothetical protein
VALPWANESDILYVPRIRLANSVRTTTIVLEYLSII